MAEQYEQIWWSPEEWAYSEFMGPRNAYSAEMVRRYCRRGDLDSLNAGTIRKVGRRWQLRIRRLSDEEIRTEEVMGGLRRLAIIGVTYDSRLGTWHWPPRVASVTGSACRMGSL